MTTIQRPTRAPAPSPATGQGENVQQGNAEQAPARPLVVRAPDATPIVAPKKYHPKIAKAILTISRSITPVDKGGWNDFHKYRYPKWEDVNEQLAPLIVQHGLIIEQSETAHGGFAADLIEISYEFTIINEDGDVWPDKPQITAICKVRDKNGTIDDKAASKCHTQAAKYMLTSLFKIRVAEMADADADPRTPPPVRRRPVPAPNGKLPPHLIQVIKDEAAADWAKRFTNFIVKADSVAEIDGWYNANVTVFKKLEEKGADDPGFQAVYDGLLDAMDARTEELGGAKQEAPKGDGFPGDKPAPTRAPPPDQADANIPWSLDRRLTDNDRDWLLSLKEAFDQCHDVESIAAEQESMMMPSEGIASPYVWEKAVALVAQNIERING